jgi:hypothetical protein
MHAFAAATAAALSTTAFACFPRRWWRRSGCLHVFLFL